ncbi:lipopolysaccharide biosynthesis protein [Sphingomonas humi]|uniref:Polysaccharide biosynthesis protein n=1 Tax=Sphingomonas humi TaxID=335630 RepID=A0ABP7RKW6_9SPHN
MSETAAAAPAPAAPDNDLAALARGGRINFMGFLLRLAARLPFLFIAGRMYGAEALGRFAYAVLVVEFVAQLSTLGLKRGLAEQLSKTDKPHVCITWDALLVALAAAVVGMAILFSFPKLMFPNSEIYGLEWLLPVAVLALAWSDVMLAALAYRHDVGATVRARAIVEPWTISIAAFAFAFFSKRDGLIFAYALSMIGALIASMIPFFRTYGRAIGWRPNPADSWRLARRYMPIAAADTVEWGSRRIDLAILGLFASPALVGIYYVAQNVASLPSKLKTSFDPILGPVISRSLEEGDRVGVAKQIRQVGFWVIAAQAAVALALGIPGEGVMGLVGPVFVAGTAALIFLLGAEVIAATATTSEAALIYIARHRNMMLSIAMLALQAMLTVALILLFRRLGWPDAWQATAPAVALCLGLAFAAIAKSRLASRLLGAPVSGWRWPLVWAAAAAVAVGQVTKFFPEWLELGLGIPLILAAFGLIIWRKGFGPEDRLLFKMKKKDIAVDLPAPGTTGDAAR